MYKKPSIIIVEDELIVATDTKARLENLGYKVDGIAVSSDKALTLIQKKRPNLVLMDIKLKGRTTGIETAIKIKEKFNIPIIYITALTDRETLMMVKETDPFGFITKPFDDIELMGVIETSLHKFQMEQKLRESEENLREAQRIAHLGSWSLDLETQKFTVSEEMIHIYKYEKKYKGSVHMEEFLENIHPDDRERVLSAFYGAIEGKKPYNLNFRIIRTDGEERILHAQGDVVEDEFGKPIKIIGTGQDITERKKAEAEIKQLQVDWENIFEAIGHCALILDSDYTILSANMAAVKPTGLSKKDLIGKKCYKIFHKTNKPPEVCPMKKIIHSGKMETHEMEVEALGGKFFVSCTPILNAKKWLEKVIHIAININKK
ncbi:MAG: PAS domain S-box protein [bacterium]